jgi:hypothetical protein
MSIAVAVTRRSIVETASTTGPLVVVKAKNGSRTRTELSKAARPLPRKRWSRAAGAQGQVDRRARARARNPEALIDPAADKLQLDPRLEIVRQVAAVQLRRPGLQQGEQGLRIGPQRLRRLRVRLHRTLAVVIRVEGIVPPLRHRHSRRGPEVEERVRARERGRTLLRPRLTGPVVAALSVEPVVAQARDNIAIEGLPAAAAGAAVEGAEVVAAAGAEVEEVADERRYAYV